MEFGSKLFVKFLFTLISLTPLITATSIRITTSDKMVVAKWKGKVIAESANTVIVEGNHYFPFESVRKEFLQPCSKTTTCAWKGTSNYFDIVVDGEVNSGAAWYYKEPKTEAAKIKGMVAFWKGVEIHGAQ